VETYNAKEDLRHRRRTLGPEELQALIQAAQTGPAYSVTRGRQEWVMSGPQRALVYRVVVSTGLRFNEIRSATTHAFELDANPPVVRVAAAYTKNGDEAEQYPPSDVVADLCVWLATRPPGGPAFDLPEGGGGRMLRFDLEAAGVRYKDDAGRFFDFHSLRCQFCTELDRQGTSPRVVQRLMRHSALEQSDQYTRPRAVDLQRAVTALPSFRPDPQTEAQALRATGTESVQRLRATEGATAARGEQVLRLSGSHLGGVEQRLPRTLTRSNVPPRPQRPPSLATDSPDPKAKSRAAAPRSVETVRPMPAAYLTELSKFRIRCNGWRVVVKYGRTTRSASEDSAGDGCGCVGEATAANREPYKSRLGAAGKVSPLDVLPLTVSA
jgi:hypothetical protein